MFQRRNVFFLILALGLIGWGASYNNCGSGLDDQADLGGIQNTNATSNTEALVQPTNLNLEDVLKATVTTVREPTPTDAQRKMVEDLSKSNILPPKEIVVASAASFLSNGSPNGIVKAISVLSNQKILIGGCFTTYHGLNAARIARLNTDGTLDSTFTSGTGVTNGANVVSPDCFGETSVQAIAVQPDSKVLVGGNFANYNGVARKGLVRINSNGTIDTSFNVGTGFGLSWSQNQYTVNSIVVLSSGKILVAGAFDSYNGAAVNAIVRLNSNGTLDTSFSLGGNGPKIFTAANPMYGDPSGVIRSIDVNPANGDIYAGGTFARWNNNLGKSQFVKLSASGSIDGNFVPSSFIPSGSLGVNKVLFSTARNSVLVARDLWDTSIFSEVNLTSGAPMTAILNALPWPNAGSSGMNNIFGKTLVILQNGKILGGSSDVLAMAASNGMRANSSLTLMNSPTTGVDQTYANVLKAPSAGTVHGTVYVFAVQADGNVLVGGDFLSHRYPNAGGTQTPAANLIRLSPNQGMIAP